MWSILISVSLVTAGNSLPVPQNKHIAAAARDYRLAVYDTLRQDRAQYDAHRAAGDRLLQDWVASREPAENQNLVVDWYAQNTRSLRSGENANFDALPNLPKHIAVDTAAHPKIKTPPAQAPSLLTDPAPPSPPSNPPAPLPTDIQIDLTGLPSPSEKTAPPAESVVAKAPVDFATTPPLSEKTTSSKGSVYGALKQAFWNSAVNSLSRNRARGR